MVPSIEFASVPSLRRLAVLTAVVALLTGGASTTATAQAFDASLLDDDVTPGEEGENTTLVVTGFSGEVTLRSPNVTNERLAEMVDGRPADDGVRVTIPDDGNVTVRFPPRFDCAPGRYPFTVVDADRTANLTVDVSSAATHDAHLDWSNVTVPPGATAALEIEVDRCLEESVTLRIGGPEAAFEANVTVTANATADTTGTVRFDTGNASAPDAFAFGPPLHPAETTVTRAPSSGGLPSGQYEVTLFVGDVEADLGLLNVDRGAATPTPTVTDATGTAGTHSPTADSVSGTGPDEGRSATRASTATGPLPEDLPGVTVAGALVAVVSFVALATVVFGSGRD